MSKHDKNGLPQDFGGPGFRSTKAPEATPIPHAINRALERYGLRLNYDDLDYLCRECQKGYGRLSFLPGGVERHILLCHGKAVVAIYGPPNGTTIRHPTGKIITILPPDAAYSGAPGTTGARVNSQRFRPRPKAPKKARQQRGW